MTLRSGWPGYWGVVCLVALLSAGTSACCPCRRTGSGNSISNSGSRKALEGGLQSCSSATKTEAIDSGLKPAPVEQPDKQRAGEKTKSAALSVVPPVPSKANLQNHNEEVDSALTSPHPVSGWAATRLTERAEPGPALKAATALARLRSSLDSRNRRTLQDPPSASQQTATPKPGLDQRTARPKTGFDQQTESPKPEFDQQEQPAELTEQTTTNASVGQNPNPLNDEKQTQSNPEEMLQSRDGWHLLYAAGFGEELRGSLASLVEAVKSGERKIGVVFPSFHGTVSGECDEPTQGGDGEIECDVVTWCSSSSDSAVPNHHAHRAHLRSSGELAYMLVAPDAFGSERLLGLGDAEAVIAWYAKTAESPASVSSRGDDEEKPAIPPAASGLATAF